MLSVFAGLFDLFADFGHRCLYCIYFVVDRGGADLLAAFPRFIIKHVYYCCSINFCNFSLQISLIVSNNYLGFNFGNYSEQLNRSHKEKSPRDWNPIRSTIKNSWTQPDIQHDQDTLKGWSQAALITGLLGNKNLTDSKIRICSNDGLWIMSAHTNGDN